MPTFFRLQGSVNSAQGPALNGVSIYVCTQPAVTTSVPPSPLATIYSDNAGANPINQTLNPVQTDGLGNWFCYAATGTYTIVIVDPINRIPTTVFIDQQVVSPGGGSVTSIGVAMPAEFSVSGSPVTASGTITVSKANQNANLVYAGPSSGGAAAPTFRTLVSADLPAGVGTVTSVTLGVSAGALFSTSVSGTNPITGSGTFTLNLNFANQNANTVLAGPVSGGAGAVTARALVAADICLVVAVAFSATPTFNAGLAAIPTFTMTLTGNVTSSTITNATAGQLANFVIKQDGTGGWTFAWPPTVKDPPAVAPDATLVSVSQFLYDGAFWRPTGAGYTMVA